MPKLMHKQKHKQARRAVDVIEEEVTESQHGTSDDVTTDAIAVLMEIDEVTQ